MPVQHSEDRWEVLPDGSKVRRALRPESAPGDQATSTPGEASSVGATGAVLTEEKGGADKKWPVPLTHAQADKQAKQRELVFPPEVKTVKDKQAFLADA